MTDHSDLIAELQGRAVSYRLGGPSSEHTALLLDRAADALSSQSLSEAREEIERLRWENGRLAIESDRVETWLNVALEALKPFAKAAAIRLCGGDDHWTDEKRIQGTDIAFHIMFGDLRRAQSALENSKARLADAPSKSPDPSLSSLRKGAEVEKARQAVERLANVQMNISLEEWGELSNAILSALVSGSREEQS